MSRVDLNPTSYRLLHLLGDVHMGLLAADKKTKTAADMAHRLVPKPLLRIQVGDMLEAPPPTYAVSTITSWLNGFGDPWISAIGNHDIGGNVVTADQANISYGMSGKNYVDDRFDWCRIIVLGPEALDIANEPARIQLSQATLDFLTASLNGTTKRCLVVCHAPLFNTVGGSQTTGNPSNVDQFYVVGPNLTDDTEIRTILGAHTNATAWISGHTHASLGATNVCCLTTCGSRSVPHINCSSIHYTGQIGVNPNPANGLTAAQNTAYREAFSDLCSLYLNMFDDRLEIRFRNHGAGVWTTFNGSRVYTFTLS